LKSLQFTHNNAAIATCSFDAKPRHTPATMQEEPSTDTLPLMVQVFHCACKCVCVAGVYHQPVCMCVTLCGCVSLIPTWPGNESSGCVRHCVHMCDTENTWCMPRMWLCYPHSQVAWE